MDIKIETKKDDTWQNLVKVEGINLKKIALVPVWEISTEKTTETIQDADGKPVGYSSKITKVSTVRLYPDDLSKKEVIKPKIDKRFKKNRKKVDEVALQK